MESVRVSAPQRPSICPDKERPARVEDSASRATLYVFTANWCRACERLLGELEGVRDALSARQIAVRNIVVGEGDSCMRAAGIARQAVFPYGVASAALQKNWRVRSTPTLWLVGGDDTALLYIEGEPDMDALLDEIKRHKGK